MMDIIELKKNIDILVTVMISLDIVLIVDNSVYTESIRPVQKNILYTIRYNTTIINLIKSNHEKDNNHPPPSTLFNLHCFY